MYKINWKDSFSVEVEEIDNQHKKLINTINELIDLIEGNASDITIDAFNLFLMLHADHEQNCSTSTVRMAGSSRANLFDSVSAGISALGGPLHGGANIEVIRMLEKVNSRKTTGGWSIP